MATTFLTQEGFDELQAELDYLRKEKRQEVADRLREAADGEDLIENAEYEAAKNEQAFVEGKIQDLEALLAAAKIISETPAAIASRWAPKWSSRKKALKLTKPMSSLAPRKLNPRKAGFPMNRRSAKR